MANHEKHIDDLLRDALGDHTEMPPSGAWAGMEDMLANADGAERIDNVLHGALADYTEVPPASAWADMETRLTNADGAEHIDDMLHGALGDYTEVPPAAAWIGMEKMLDEKPSRRRPFAWFWYAAALTGVLLVAYMFLDKNENSTSYRNKATSGAVVTTPAPQIDNATNNETVTPKVQEKIPENVVAPKTVHKEAKKETPVTAPQHKQAQEQKAAPVVKNETPAQKVQDTPKEEPQVAQQVPATPVSTETVSKQQDSVQQKDDIAAAMNKRGSGTVMNVIKSRYADSMKQVEKELAKQQEEKAAIDTTVATAPVIAATSDTIIDVAKEETTIQPDTISVIAKEAIDKTEENMVVKQDAIPGSEIKVPVEKIEFEEPETVVNVNTATADPEKGSLAGFIGPSPNAESYTNAWSGIGAGAPYKIRLPLQLDVFMKLGMETGTSQYKANKYVFAPSIQARLSDRFSLIFQPAFKMGNVNFSGIGREEKFYHIESSYMDTIITPPVVSWNAQGIPSERKTANYYYQETYDSIGVSHALNSSRVMEAEAPLMLSYKLTKDLAVYGGPVVGFSNMLQIDEKINRYKTETRRDTISYLVEGPKAVPGSTPIREVFTYEGKKFSEYQPAPYANSSVNKIRFGYMLGMSYNYKRFSADLSVQQNLSRLNYIPNAAVKNIYLQPYTRFMIGYQLNNRKK